MLVFSKTETSIQNNVLPIAVFLCHSFHSDFFLFLQLILNHKMKLQLHPVLQSASHPAERLAEQSQSAQCIREMLAISLASTNGRHEVEVLECS